MDAAQIVVTVGGAALIAAVLLFFFGRGRRDASAEARGSAARRLRPRRSGASRKALAATSRALPIIPPWTIPRRLPRPRLRRGCSITSRWARSSGSSPTAAIARWRSTPQLRLIFGYPVETAERAVCAVRPRAVHRSAGAPEPARAAPARRLGHRLPGPRPPRRPHADLGRDHRPRRGRRRTAASASRRWSATSATARSSTTRRATSTTSCCRPRSWRRSARRSRASRTS